MHFVICATTKNYREEKQIEKAIPGYKGYIRPDHNIDYSKKLPIEKLTGYTGFAPKFDKEEERL